LVGRKTSEVVENEYESSFGEGQHSGWPKTSDSGQLVFAGGNQRFY
jgi:hypothetical protein